MKHSEYRVAIIGTGRMGGLIEDELSPNQFSSPYGHFSAYTAIEQTEVVSVANRGTERLKRFTERFGITNTYLDYCEMIEKEQPDIVSVTTPSFARAEPIIFAAEHGVRGIYAEKGLCASLAEADRIVAALKGNNVAFNWGAMRRHHDGYIRLRDAIARGDIGEPRYAVMYTYTDIIKHHPHTLDLVSMLLGDPAPSWVEGRLVDKDDPLAAGMGQQRPRAFPHYDSAGHCFVPPPGEEIADPMVGYFRIGYANNTEGIFVPIAGPFSIDVHGTEGRAYAWDNGDVFCVRRGVKGGSAVDEKIIKPTGESPTVCTIRNIIREIETGERTDGNIDVTMQSVEAQFGIAHSHLQGGERVALPVADRSLYIPGG
ncbi:MAG: Gfo/Idh/MocA family oxidoreductase [Candidatus Poribacteria bacterium]|nr:Gfo/Idh/MocA family oxidoreductase [Candidatus Poribacteria bacterium]